MSGPEYLIRLNFLSSVTRVFSQNTRKLAQKISNLGLMVLYLIPIQMLTQVI